MTQPKHQPQSAGSIQSCSDQTVVSDMSQKSIVLVIRNIGHVPSFKNHKLLTRGRTITDPKKQKWMKLCIQGFVSQLLSKCQISETGTLTEHHLRSLIALLPQDDNWKHMPELSVSAIQVDKGKEGAFVTIEKI